MSGKRLIIVASAIGIIGATFFLLRDRVLFAIGNFLVLEDKLQPADVIHVIAGPDVQTDYAIRLYKQGYGQRIFLTGGWCREHNFYHGQHGKGRAHQHGIPLSAIVIDDSRVISTYSEVVRLKEYMDHEKQKVLSVMVVSNPYHMRRARWTYRRVLGDDVTLRMAPVPFGLSPYKRQWWKDKDSRGMVWAEYAKMIYYHARYQFSRGFLQDWLASLDRN